MNDVVKRVTDNLAAVEERIAEASRSSGRHPGSVTLVAVTKYGSLPAVRALLAAGAQNLGESRPQQLWERASQFNERVRWHLIGHLQRNKIRRTLPLVALVHSVDSLRLAKAIDEEARLLNQPAPVLVEVNISGEANKHGFRAEEVASAIDAMSALAHLRVMGLMAMASWEGGAEAAEHDFERMRELRDRLRSACPARAGLEELSMGMSGDFEAAIRQGSTMVRVGSALFEGVERDPS